MKIEIEEDKDLGATVGVGKTDPVVEAREFISARRYTPEVRKLLRSLCDEVEALREAAKEALKVLSLEFPGSIKRKAAMAQLRKSLENLKD